MGSYSEKFFLSSVYDNLIELLDSIRFFAKIPFSREFPNNKYRSLLFTSDKKISTENILIKKG